MTVAALGLRPILVEHLDQVQRLRLLRNATREGFSFDTHEIGEAEQFAWWERMRGRVLAWLYADGAGLVVGFGVLRQTEDGRWWTSVGVLPEHGGRGYGRAITADLVLRCPGRVWATARRDNPPAVKLHVPRLWDEIEGEDARRVYFRGRYPTGDRARLVVQQEGL